MGKQTIVKNFRHTIGFLLFKKIFLAYLLFVVLFTSFQIYTEYNFAKKLIKKDLINTEQSFKTVLAKTVWVFDKKKIDEQVQAIIDAKTVKGIVILTPFNEFISVKGKILPKFSKIDKFVFENTTLENIEYDTNLISHSFELKNFENKSEEVLGTVTLFVPKNQIAELTQEAISLILINVIVSALMLWFLFIYFANKLLTEPLNKMIEATNDYDVQEFNEINIEFDDKKHNELNTLAQTFNQMSRRINEAYINMKQLTMIQDKQKHDLENANKYKTDFLANMSHELKTPLNSINVISSVMMKNKDDSLDQKQVQNLKIINNCGNDLLFLINDVLDISKLEAGELTLDYTQVNMCDLMHSIKDMFAPQVQEKNLEFVFNCDSNIGDVYTDPNRVKQIIKNLLSNALKFVKNGEVKLLVKDSENSVEILVKDSGIGIAQEKLDHIFDRFKQADGSTTRKYGGTGLGLSICKELLVLLGGDISVKSKVDVGSIFRVLIPKNKEKVQANTIANDEVSLMSVEKNINNKILLLNNDPVTYLSIVVELNKVYEVTQVTKASDFIKVDNTDEFSLTILDISKLNENEINKTLSNVNNNIVIVYENNLSNLVKEKGFDSFKKPFDKESFIEFINNKKV
ncbi:HAMP domain-containing sensor histidine kinase [Arcobacter roscoffensis]|uniref:histidine kinase n=1 Tax=Arcobacter roscoffensis TaxID=2961520 RepID=A0ABY5E7Y3_9BACT|nr:HAMP domain-containing sensor histidine kinase [Arcobacter roscoffensis]UTJ07875.1 HAMP domain-containing histidine kinase [Arcobacter roscoffensis]